MASAYTPGNINVNQPFQLDDNNPVGFGLDKGWILLCAGFVFLMQVGLGLMEYGAVRRKNSRVVWFKILLNLVNAIWWWFIIGYAWGFGEVNGSFVGAQAYYAGSTWFGANNQFINYLTAQYAHFVWICAIALVATTIATGIMAERISMKAVVLFNLVFNLIILPFVFAWTFGFGFLVDDIGYRDFAGAFIVFGVGAVAGLGGLIPIGARYNRYGRYPSVIPLVPAASVNDAGYITGDPMHRPASTVAASRNLPSAAFDRIRQEPSAPIGFYSAPAEVPAATAFNADNIIRARKRQDEDEYEHFGITNYGAFCLGALIFFIGFIFFNAGASKGLRDPVHYNWAEVSAANTLLGAAGGGILATIVLVLFGRKRAVRENAATLARAIIAGCVANSASCNDHLPWAGLVIGMLGALAYFVLTNIIYRTRLDDPTEFFSIFAGAGFMGICCAAFWNGVNGIYYDNATEGEILIYQLLSVAILIGWTFLISLIAHSILNVANVLRIGLKAEIVGYDYIDGARHLDYPEKGSVRKLPSEKVK